MVTAAKTTPRFRFLHYIDYYHLVARRTKIRLKLLLRAKLTPNADFGALKDQIFDDYDRLRPQNVGCEKKVTWDLKSLKI